MLEDVVQIRRLLQSDKSTERSRGKASCESLLRHSQRVNCFRAHDCFDLLKSVLEYELKEIQFHHVQKGQRKKTSGPSIEVPLFVLKITKHFVENNQLLHTKAGDVVVHSLSILHRTEIAAQNGYFDVHKDILCCLLNDRVGFGLQFRCFKEIHLLLMDLCIDRKSTCDKKNQRLLVALCKSILTDQSREENIMRSILGWLCDSVFPIFAEDDGFCGQIIPNVCECCSYLLVSNSVEEIFECAPYLSNIVQLSCRHFPACLQREMVRETILNFFNLMLKFFERLQVMPNLPVLWNPIFVDIIHHLSCALAIDEVVIAAANNFSLQRGVDLKDNVGSGEKTGNYFNLVCRILNFQAMCGLNSSDLDLEVRVIPLRCVSSTLVNRINEGTLLLIAESCRCFPNGQFLYSRVGVSSGIPRCDFNELVTLVNKTFEVLDCSTLTLTLASRLLSALVGLSRVTSAMLVHMSSSNFLTQSVLSAWARGVATLFSHPQILVLTRDVKRFFLREQVVDLFFSLFSLHYVDHLDESSIASVAVKWLEDLCPCPSTCTLAYITSHFQIQTIIIKSIQTSQSLNKDMLISVLGPTSSRLTLVFAFWTLWFESFLDVGNIPIKGLHTFLNIQRRFLNTIFDFKDLKDWRYEEPHTAFEDLVRLVVVDSNAPRAKTPGNLPAKTGPRVVSGNSLDLILVHHFISLTLKGLNELSPVDKNAVNPIDFGKVFVLLSTITPLIRFMNPRSSPLDELTEVFFKTFKVALSLLSRSIQTIRWNEICIVSDIIVREFDNFVSVFPVGALAVWSDHLLSVGDLLLELSVKISEFVLQNNTSMYSRFGGDLVEGSVSKRSHSELDGFEDEFTPLKSPKYSLDLGERETLVAPLRFLPTMEQTAVLADLAAGCSLVSKAIASSGLQDDFVLQLHRKLALNSDGSPVSVFSAVGLNVFFLASRLHPHGSLPSFFMESKWDSELGCVGYCIILESISNFLVRSDCFTEEKDSELISMLECIVLAFDDVLSKFPVQFWLVRKLQLKCLVGLCSLGFYNLSKEKVKEMLLFYIGDCDSRVRLAVGEGIHDLIKLFGNHSRVYSVLRESMGVFISTTSVSVVDDSWLATVCAINITRLGVSCPQIGAQCLLDLMKICSSFIEWDGLRSSSGFITIYFFQFLSEMFNIFVSSSDCGDIGVLLKDNLMWFLLHWMQPNKGEPAMLVSCFPFCFLNKTVSSGSVVAKSMKPELICTISKLKDKRCVQINLSELNRICELPDDSVAKLLVECAVEVRSNQILLTSISHRVQTESDISAVIGAMDSFVGVVTDLPQESTADLLRRSAAFVVLLLSQKLELCEDSIVDQDLVQEVLVNISRFYGNKSAADPSLILKNCNLYSILAHLRIRLNDTRSSHVASRITSLISLISDYSVSQNYWYLVKQCFSILIFNSNRFCFISAAIAHLVDSVEGNIQPSDHMFFETIREVLFSFVAFCRIYSEDHSNLVSILHKIDSKIDLSQKNVFDECFEKVISLIENYNLKEKFSMYYPVPRSILSDLSRDFPERISILFGQEWSSTALNFSAICDEFCSGIISFSVLWTQIVGLGDWIESHAVAEDVAVILLSGLLKLQSHLSSKKLTIFTEDIVHIIGRIGCKDLFSLDHSQLYLNPVDDNIPFITRKIAFRLFNIIWTGNSRQTAAAEFCLGNILRMKSIVKGLKDSRYPWWTDVLNNYYHKPMRRNQFEGKDRFAVVPEPNSDYEDLILGFVSSVLTGNKFRGHRLVCSDLFLQYLSPIATERIDLCEMIFPLLVWNLVSSLENGEGNISSLTSVFKEYFLTPSCSLKTSIACSSLVFNVRQNLKIFLSSRNFEAPEISNRLRLSHSLDISHSEIIDAAVRAGLTSTALFFVEILKDVHDVRVGSDVLVSIYREFHDPDSMFCLQGQLVDLRIQALQYSYGGKWLEAMSTLESMNQFESASGSSCSSMDLSLGHLISKRQDKSILTAWSTPTSLLPDRHKKWNKTISEAILNIVNQEYLDTKLIHSYFDVANELLFCLNSSAKRESAGALMNDIALCQHIVEIKEAIGCIESSRIQDFSDLMVRWKCRISGQPYGQLTSYLDRILELRVSLFCLVSNQYKVPLECFSQVADIVFDAVTSKSMALNFSPLFYRLKGKLFQTFSSGGCFSSKEIFVKLKWSLREAILLWERGQHVIAQTFLDNEVIQQFSICTFESDVDGSHVSDLCSEALRLRGEWSLANRMTSSSKIASEYFSPAGSEAKSDNQRIKVNRSLGHFFSALFRTTQERTQTREWDQCERLARDRKAEYERCRLILQHERSKVGKSKDLSDELKALARHTQTLKKEIDLDENDRRQTHVLVHSSLISSLTSFMDVMRLSAEPDVDCSFQFVNLWLSYSSNAAVNEAINESILTVPSYKFIPLTYQIFSRIDDVQSEASTGFQEVLSKLVIRMCTDHPHHTLYQLFALSNIDLVDVLSFKSNVSPGRCQAAKDLILKLKSSPNGHYRNLVNSTQQLLLCYISLAKSSTEALQKQNKIKNVMLRDLSVEGMRLEEFLSTSTSRLPVLTSAIPIQKDLNYDSLSFIESFQPTFSITESGISRPKIIDCTGSDGLIYKQLVKNGDDMRQDAIMQQVFWFVNHLFSCEMQTRMRNLHIRTYKIIPLTPQTGVIEWVKNTTPFGQYLCDKTNGAHFRHRPQDWSHSKCRDYLKSALIDNALDRQTRFLEIYRNFSPVFRYFFFEHYCDPALWISRRLAYTRSVAATSMVGYILGIGDRHSHNILIDTQSAEVVHIDFGIVFDQGKGLGTPETVPFRLTRDIIDGMGISKFEGTFRCCSEQVLNVLRGNTISMLTILEVVIHDPLYKWSLSPREARRRQPSARSEGDVFFENKSLWVKAEVQSEEKRSTSIGQFGRDSGERALSRIKSKLLGIEDSRGEGLSVSGHVDSLIIEATAPENLCKLFPGWAPWL